MKINRLKAFILPLALCAAFTVQHTAYAQSAESTAEVEFVAGTGPTYPVHPEDPDTDGNGGPVDGSLAIVIVSNFDFGSIPVEAATRLFGIETIMPNIQVVDLRGTAAGWKVSADVSRFSNGSGDTLPGAAIHIADGRPRSKSTSPAPSQSPVVLAADGLSVERVVTAASGAGMGHWVMRWYPPAGEGVYIRLEVPAGTATLGSHSAIINWILEDTP